MLPSLLTLLLYLPASPVLSAQIVEAATNDFTSTSSIEAYVKAVQIDNGLGDDFYYTMRCESAWWKNIQSGHKVATGPNGQEDSWGVAQWNMPAGNKTQDGRVITREMALDVKLAVDTAAWYFTKGWHKKWSCWNDLYGT